MKKPSEIEGLISDNEGRFLQKLAEQTIRTDYPVFVEVGSWKGKSTAYLASVIPESSGGIVVAIENFSGIETGKRNTMRELWKNLNDAGVDDIVEIVRPKKGQDSFSAYINHCCGEHIDFLFIDGAHDEKSVLNDAILTGLLVPGSWVAFHDAMGGFPGVRDVVRSVIFNSHQWDRIEFHGSIVAARKSTEEKSKRFRLKKLFWEAACYYVKNVKPHIPDWLHRLIRKSYPAAFFLG